MNKITCDLCMDLMPLVRDGIASNESKKAVELHIKSCVACNTLYSGEIPSTVNVEKAFQKFRRKVQFFSILLMMFGIFFGLGLTAGADMFYNSLIMPIIGVLGYIIFRWKALYNIPILLFITHSFINIFKLFQENEYLDFASLLIWTILYIIFAWIGICITGLLHYAFRKED